MRETVLIICGGGPAPGINTVISTVAKSFLKADYRVIGLHNGYEGLFLNEPDIVNIDYKMADRIFSRGGSALIMSRFKPRENQMSTDFFERHNVKLLVTIGGDDTASTACRISEFMKLTNRELRHIHVPKTIDNDLPLPDRNPTFGFHSAKNEGVRIGNTVYEDARTSNLWFVMSSMGRSAGHLAFGIASACHFPLFIVPEMFNETKISIDKLVSLMMSTILKRKLQGLDYGVILISEGVFHLLDEEELKKANINFSYDAHGHPELSLLSKSHFFNELLAKRLKQESLRIKLRPVEVGYELRCCNPIAYDLTLCTLLGIGVKKLYDDGYTNCIVSANSNGDIIPIQLEELLGEENKIQPRLLDINSEMVQLFISEMDYLTPEDVENAKGIIPGADNYEFKSILNWN
ncbi:MAG: 6-phosphofructokinase [Flavobacteriaceae bacterium]